MINRKCIYWPMFLLYSPLTVSAPAPSSLPSMFHSTIQPFAAITVSANFLRASKAQSLTLLPPFTNYYTNHSSSYQSTGSLGLTAGIEGRQLSHLFWQLGASGYFNTQVTTHGQVWQFGLPEFNNFTYRYQVQSSRIVATAKLLSTVKKRVHPYLSGELGASFNRASAYNEVPLLEEAYPMAPFRDHTHSSLAWGVGAGIDADITTMFRLGLGYQFADLGKAQLGVSPAQETQQVLNIPHLYSHQLRFQLTALI